MLLKTYLHNQTQNKSNPQSTAKLNHCVFPLKGMLFE